ncbi:MAG: DUF1697 domain-containing protein [Patescibacteria group bacterium]|nr:DUF1697 domain-containing protein [Patescibacteria group bacterium]
MQYVALLRGIMPGNPNMRSDRLKAFFESLGFSRVRTVIGSGNVVFETAKKDPSAIEAAIERALPKELGFKSTAIVRSQREMEALVKKDPFKGIKDEEPNYLIVTFFKDRKKELCTVIDLGSGRTPDFMRKIEKAHGKEITTRTWKTVGRILKKMGEEGA